MLEELDAMGLAQAIRQKKMASLELVQETIRRANRVNPILNAIVYETYDQALQAAKDLDEGKDLTRLAKPFSGVPLFLKDLGQERQGDVITNGSRLFKTYRARETDYFVEALEQLGFIILGRTNTPELGYKTVSDALLHGSVKLPFDLSRNAGGSSGGAAALVSAGVSPLAAASDGGGSIRIPASHNGLIGLKPSRGRIVAGPRGHRGWNGATVHFALTKSVKDTRSLLYYLQAYQVESPFPMPLLSSEILKGRKIEGKLRIGLLLDSPVKEAVSSSVQEAVLKTAAFLESLGHEVEEIGKDPIDGLALQAGFYIISGAETALMFQKISQGLSRQLRVSDMELMTWAIYRSGLKIPAYRHAQVIADWDRYSLLMHQLHEHYDILLLPTVAQPAPKEGAYDLSEDLKAKLLHMDDYSHEDQQALIWQMFEKSVADTPFTQRFNMTGQPAISLPVHQTPEGLPLGVQLVAAKGREDLLLDLAQVFEDEGFLTRLEPVTNFF